MKTVRLSTPLDLHIHLSDFYDQLVYDGSPEFKDYIPRGLWLTFYEDDKVAGLANLEPLNNVMWTAHVMLYTSHRGHGSEDWGKQAAQYMKDNLGAKKILAFTPYKAAKKYAERMGFTYIDTISRSIQKNNELMDQYMLELTL